MAMTPHFHLCHVLRSNRGAVLVEFALVLPLLVLLFATIIEGGRMMWSYQTAVAGVRDAARYVGRVVPSNVCTTKEPISKFVTNDALATIIRNSIQGDVRTGSSGAGTQYSVLPSNVVIDPNGVTPVAATLTCVEGSGVAFRIAKSPVATVSARVRINFPFEGLFDLSGGALESFVVTTITDQSRVFGS